MPPMIGADADELDRAAAELRAAADELDAHSSALTSLLSSIQWAGEVANRFVGAWSGAHRVNLTSTSQFFRAAADQLARNAREQREASGVGVGGGVAGSGGGAGRLPGSWRPGDPLPLLPFGPGLGGPLGLMAPDLDPGWLFDVAKLTDGVANAAPFIKMVGNVQYPLTARTFQEMLTTTQVPGANVLGKFGNAVQVLSVGQDLYSLYGNVAEGDYGGAAMDGVGLGITAASRGHPYVAAAKVSWDVGWWIGGQLDEQFQISDRSSDNILHDTMMTEYGTTELTPSQASELSSRYDGAMGFAHFAGDSVRSGWNDAKSLVGGLFD